MVCRLILRVLIFIIRIVFDILLKLINGCNMPTALKEAIPTRKIEELYKQEEDDEELDAPVEKEENQSDSKILNGAKSGKEGGNMQEKPE